jgi:4-hydroxythreonine-4-phosphate dehydrogenase
VADLITKQRVLNGIELLREAILLYGLESPRIAVAALNPHGGEGGLIGREEIEQITPAIQEAVSRGINVSGPIPAETIFMRAFRGEFDGVVSLYHDQANIAQKTAKFGCSVAFYVRSQIPITTPAHGFAIDIAGKGIADPNNLKLAIELASHLATIKKIKGD